MPRVAKGAGLQQRLDKQGIAGAAAAAQELLAAQRLAEPAQFDGRGPADPGRQQRHGGFRRQHVGIQGDGVGVEQRTDGHFVADGGFGHRNPHRDSLAGKVALQLAELAAVPDDHGDVRQFTAVVHLGFQDPLCHVPQFMDRRRQQVRLDGSPAAAGGSGGRAPVSPAEDGR